MGLTEHEKTFYQVYLNFGTYGYILPNTLIRVY